MKKDFLTTYKKDLCEESREFVEKADTPQAFLRILGEFVAHIGMKDLPTIEWARKWFKNEISLLNKCGVYLDQICMIEDTKLPFVFLFGDCSITYSQSQPHLCRIVARDNSTLNLLLFGCGSTIVRLHGNASQSTFHKEYLHTLKVHKI